MDIARKMGHRENISILLTNLGILAYVKKNNKQAQEYFQGALTISLKMGHQRLASTLTTNLEKLASDWRNIEAEELTEN